MEKQANYLTPDEVEAEFKIPKTTQAVWRCVNRYGWRRLTIKRGSRILYARSDLEKWMESRRTS